MVRCERCGIVPQKLENLPVLLPDDIEITGEGDPLDKHPIWKERQYPKRGGKVQKESDTLDTFFESSWYYARFTSDEKTWENVSIEQKSAKYWLGVGEYMGGIRHAILHLLYARSSQKALRDLGYLDGGEPFSRLLTQGMVLRDGAKMSKSKGNVVSPDDIIEKYGADTARLFILFAAPSAKEFEWNNDALEGAYRLIVRLYDKALKLEGGALEEISQAALGKEEKYARLKVYEVLKKSQEAYVKNLAFNILIAACTKALNAIGACKNQALERKAFFIILNILEPIIPYVCFELSEKLLHFEDFKKLELKSEAFMKDSLNLDVSVNGKKRVGTEVSASLKQDEIIQLAKEKVAKRLEGKNVIKEIYVPNSPVNLAVK